MFNTGSNQGSDNGAPEDGAPSSCACMNLRFKDGIHTPECPGHPRNDTARTELARYKAGLNYRRGYLDALKSVAPNSAPEWFERRADEAVKKFLEAFR